MIYGPLAQAIEQLLACHHARPPKRDAEGNAEYDANISRAWNNIAIEMDRFYLDVKEGRIEQGD